MAEKRATGENDVPSDSATASSRATGGQDRGDGPEPQDRHSTTGTTPSETFVGRASGDETADAGESGGERREGRSADSHDGALREE